MDQIDWLVVFSRALHILAAMALLGGAMHARAHWQPVEETDSTATRRWSKVVFTGIGVLFLTGGLNFWRLGFAEHVERIYYHGLFGIKFLLALGLFFLASAMAGRSPGLASFRRAGSRWLSVAIVLGVIVVMISGVMSQLSRPS